MTKEDTIIELLEEILLWMKYNYLETKKRLIENLDTDGKKMAYELSDGERSTRAIAKIIQPSYTTIGNWWSKWFELGLVEQTEKYGGSQYKHLCSLTKMGIKLPETKGEAHQ